MALGQELFQLVVEAVANAVMAGGFDVILAGENMAPEFVDNRSAGAQLDSLTREKLDSEFTPGQDLKVFVGHAVGRINAGQLHHSFGHRRVENIFNLAEGDWIIAEVVLDLASGETGEGVFDTGAARVY